MEAIPVAAVLIAWILLIRIPALVCAIAPGGHPGYISPLRAMPPDLGDVWIGYVSRATCTRCGAICEHCLAPATRPGDDGSDRLILFPSSPAPVAGRLGFPARPGRAPAE